MKLKKLGKGYYKVQGHNVIIQKDYDNPQYDWVVTANDQVCGSCLTLKEFKEEITKYVNGKTLENKGAKP